MSAALSWPSIRTLCGIFCCPPLPSKIAAKLAFVPPIATYTLHPVDENGLPNSDRANSVTTDATLSERASCSANSEDELVEPSTSKESPVSSSKEDGWVKGEWRGKSMKLELLDTADWQFTQKELVLMDACTSITSKGETIACLFIKTQEHSEYTLLFSHGNAVDIGQMSSFLVYLSVQLKCNILTYDYAGYGMSTGRPSEPNLYADIDAAWRCLIGRYNVPADRVVLYGQSIGTVPTIDLAARQSVAGVILHSPLLSGMRMAFPDTKQTWFFDAFPSIDKVGSIQSVVLVMHGTEDEVINISHGRTIHARCPRAVEPLWVHGAGHNDIEHYDEYLQRLLTFINVELATS